MIPLKDKHGSYFKSIVVSSHITQAYVPMFKFFQSAVGSIEGSSVVQGIMY